MVGTGGLTLFPGTPLLDEANRGEFTTLSEKEMLIEQKTFLENLTCECTLITHHTVTANLTGMSFPENKELILKKMQHAIDNIDEERMAAVRNNKTHL